MDDSAPTALYEPGDPYDSQWLSVPGGHELFIQQSGSPGGQPLLLLHGGPGSKATAMQRRLFDPARFRIVQFDQRACGRSRARAPLLHNHTDALVADIERIRDRLGIVRWLVCGGSWGATLAVHYAATHRSPVAGLLLRALFLAGRTDLDWFFGGAGALFPDEWQRFLACAPRSRRHRIQPWLWQVFAKGGDADMRRVAAAWRRWEAVVQGQTPPPAALDSEAIQRYRIQAHYLARACFLGERRVRAAVASLHGLPVLFVHGRRDFVCRPSNAWTAWCSLSGSRLLWVDEAGHDPFAPGMVRAVREAADRWLREQDFDGIGLLRRPPW
ncbi:MAG: alpha/beta fold hydrolase [Rhodocyclaceae bacterium]|nr:alpha/beta fold hydrolase [Rhodocyclaceae bacterium]